MTRRNNHLPPKSRPGQNAAPRPFKPQRHQGGPDGPYWIWGLHPVKAVLENNNRKILQFICNSGLEKSLPQALRERAHIDFLDRHSIDQVLPPGSLHQGMAILVQPLPDLALADVAALHPDRSNRLIVLDQVSDPHNVGAVLRSAAAFGARAVVVTDRHAPSATGTLAKAASGALEKVPLVRVTNLARALEEIGEMGYWRIALDGKAEKTLQKAVHGSRNVALVLGAEGDGLRRLTIEHCDESASLEISREAESLNVSNAAAVALYEHVRSSGL